jgi:hypothetical protein
LRAEGEYSGDGRTRCSEDAGVRLRSALYLTSGVSI